MSDGGDMKKRLAIIGVASLFLVAMVIGVTIGMKNADKGRKADVNASRRAVENICQPTDYKDLCVSSLEKGAPGTDNPSELAKAAFKAAMDEINHIAAHSTLLKQLEKDSKTANATRYCRELFEDAADDFRRSIEEIGSFDVINMDEILSDVRIWLSATVTYEESCLDAFGQNTTEGGMKVKKLLSKLMQMSSNGLAIVTGLQEELGDPVESSGSRRRLLSNRNRRLMNDDNDDVIPRWLDMDDRRRKLLEATKIIDELTPNVTVAQDGSGNYTTITDAFSHMPLKNKKLYVIYIKEGVYKEEQLIIQKKQKHVVLIGDGPTKTIISGSLGNMGGTKTFETCTIAIRGEKFMAKDIAFENTAGPGMHQAVAIRIQSDKSIFYNVHFNGFQDTLYPHTYRQYFRDCQISGTIDFVFGDAACFFQNCTFVVRKPLPNQQCTVLAQGRKERFQPSGIIVHKSRFVAAPDYYPERFKEKSYLARPWKEFSKAIIMESFLDDLIQPEGWLRWNQSEFGLNTSYLGEYRNQGPGANTDRRVKWGGIKTIFPSRAEKFMPPIFFQGDEWVIESGVPYAPALLSDPSTFVAAPNAIDEEPESPPPKRSPTQKKQGFQSEEDREEAEKDLYRHKKDEDDDKDKDKSPSSSKHAPSPLPSFPPALSIAQVPSQGFGAPAETPNQDSDSSSPSPIALPPTPTISPSESPSSMALADDIIVQNPSSMALADDIIVQNPSSLDDDDDNNIVERKVMQEEGPSSESPMQLITPSESPSSLINLERMLMQEEDEEASSESPSPLDKLEMSSIQDEPPTPSPMFNLKKMLMEDESPTTTPSESPEDESSTNTPSESPSLMLDLKKILLQDDSPAYTPSESPLMEEESPSESPSLLLNLEKKLLQNDDYDDASDDNDDHDKVVTSGAVKMDKILETLHLKTRVDLGFDDVMMESPNPSPSPSPNPIMNRGRVLMQSGNNNNSEANKEEIAELASSPQSKAIAVSVAQANKNGSVVNGTSPEAAQWLSQFGLDAKSLPHTPPGDQNPANSAGYKIHFRCTVLFAIMFVLFV